MGGKILIFVVILIVGLGVGMYLFNSGAFTKGVNGFNSLFPSPGSTSSSNTSSPKSTSTSFWSYLGASITPAPVGPSGVTGGQGQSAVTAPPAGGASIGSANTINPADIPAGFTAAQLSPYFHKVRFAGVAPGSIYYYGTITLSYYDYAATANPIDVTGWQIKTKNSGEYIPQAINLYDPSGLAPASDILMRSGDVVYLYSSSAPFNLRLNECIGYVAHVANFVPALPMNCPYIDRSQIQGFTGACQNFIQTIGACQQPNMTSPQIPRNDYACQDFLQNNFTYKSCFAAHAGDQRFLSNQVWVWTGGNVADQYHDNVELLDRNGLLVDLYTY